MSYSIDDISNQSIIVETCLDINERDAIESKGSFHGLLKDAPFGATAVVNGLSQQLIYQLQLMLPGVFVSYDDLNVDLGDAAFPYVQAPGKQALQRAIQARGIKLLVNSSYRTIAQQMLLFNDRFNNSYPVAPPGRSNHQTGLAIDVEDPRGWDSFLIPHGWEPLPGDPPHFDYVGSETRDIRQDSIRAFQQLWNINHPDEKIDEDGIFTEGGETEDALNRSPAFGFAKAPWDNKPRVLKLSQPRMEGSDVVRLQEALKKAEIIVAADGEFGPETDKAVKEFQKRKNLTPDGIVGPKTLGQLA